MDKKEYQRHLANAINLHPQIYSDDELAEALLAADRRLEMPEDPEDILDYLGNMDLLQMNEWSKGYARGLIKGLSRFIHQGSQRGHFWGHDGVSFPGFGLFSEP